MPSARIEQAPSAAPEGTPWAAIRFDRQRGELVLLDQRLLPTEEHYRYLRSVDDVAAAIADMMVRGAPAIGIAAAYGLALRAQVEQGEAAAFLVANGIAARGLCATRPTAVNLQWAVQRMSHRAAEVAHRAPQERYEALLEEALSIQRQDEAACRTMGEYGARDVPQDSTILTHCNAGALATGGYGTALGVIRAAHAAGKRVRVLAGETRPYLQGARLTAWELSQDGIPVEVITDSAAAHFLQRGDVQFVVVGSDRIAANGDVANKIGTYAIALAAHAHGVPFTVAAPFSTVDLGTPRGEDIPIEQRPGSEVAHIGPTRLVPQGVACRHPAFDITPARYVTALYTERGVLRPAEGQTPRMLAAAAHAGQSPPKAR